MPLECEHLLASGGVPQFDRAIKTPGRQLFAVRREGHRLDRTRMTSEGKYLLAGSCIPQLHYASIKATARQPLPVGREGHRLDRSKLCIESEQILTGGGFPQLDCAITTPHCKSLPVGRECCRKARIPFEDK